MSFDDLAAVAAVGTGQRASLPSPGTLASVLPEPDHGDPQVLAFTLLDTAAAYAVVRRGAVATAPGDPVPPAPEDTLPEPPARVTSLLAPLLADDAGTIRHASERAYVLSEALGLVAAARMRLPHRLLGVALARADLRHAVQPVLGARGEWLAAQLRDAGRDRTPTPREDVWDTGTTDERLAWFRALRDHAPAEAIESAREVWSSSPAAFRTALMTIVADTATPSDEAFCEAGLDDRADGVRTAAQRALSRLPHSAYVARMSARARTAVAVRSEESGLLSRLRGRPVRSLVVAPPEPDAAAARDGLGAGLSSADRVTRLVAAVPPASWPSLVGATAVELVTLPQDEPRWDLTVGVVEAVVRHRDGTVADALAAAGAALDARLAPLLSPPLLADVLERVPETLVGTVLSRLPLPWPSEVVTAVGRRLLGRKGHELRPEVWTQFGRGVPLRLAASWAQRLRQAGEPPNHAIRNALRETTSVLTVRSLVADELRAHLPATVWQDSAQTSPGGQS